MKLQSKRAVSYLLARLQEPSTLRGGILLCTALGAKVSPEMETAIIEIGLLLVGLVAVITPDKLKEETPKDK